MEIQSRCAELQVEKNLDPETISAYAQVFMLLDVDAGGTIENEELRLGLQYAVRKPSDQELDNLMKIVDEDGNGTIDLAEFVEFIVHFKNVEKSQRERKMDLHEDDEP